MVIKRKPQDNYERIEEIVITIDEPITHIEMSKKRRNKYYLKGSTIPLKFRSKKYKYIEGILCDSKTNEKIVKNLRSAGTPKLWRINGQD